MRHSLIVLTLGTVLALVSAGPAQAAAPAQSAPPAKAPATVQAGFAPVLAKNKIYRSGQVDSFACAPSEPRPGSAASWKRYSLLVASCVNKMWARQFKAVGWTYRNPKIVIRTSGAKTFCGRLNKTYSAHYCFGNQTIYMMLFKDRITDRNPSLVMASTVAHEIAHHVQRRIGMEPAYSRLYFGARSSSARYLVSHRLEQQAQCFAGVFLGAVQESMVDYEILDWYRESSKKYSSDKLHGKGSSQVRWFDRGFNSANPGKCNTWVVANKYVS